MSTFCNAHGTQTAVYVEPGDSPHTFDSSSERWAAVSDGVRKQASIIQGRGMRGERGRHARMTREGPYTVTGTLVFEPTPLLLDLWLPRILGAAESSDAFGVAETLQTFGLLCDRDSDTFEYADCVVSRAVLRGRAGGLVELALDIIGKTETVGTSAPSVDLGTTAADAPYAFTDLTVNIESGARKLTEFALTIDNGVTPINFHSLTPECLVPGERVVTLSAQSKLNSTELTALYEQDTEAGASASLTLTNGNMSCVAVMDRLQHPDQSPVVPGPSNFYLPVIGEVRASGSNDAIAFTNDSTA